MIAVETYVFTVDAHDLGLIILGAATGLLVAFVIAFLIEQIEAHR